MHTDSPPSLAVIIVGYNSANYLEPCFTSIFSSTHTPSTVLFIDNNSSDNSLELVSNKFPQVDLLPLEENKGFAEANNIGIQKIIEKVDFILFLNPDTILEPECIKIILETADEKTILQPLILISKNGIKTEKINTSGNKLTFYGTAFCGNYKDNYQKTMVIKNQIPTASGAACLFPSRILIQIGDFDPSYFMYQEDVDLSWRARMCGYDIRLLPNAIVWHDYTFSRSTNKYFYLERNRLSFLLKNFQLKTLLLLFPALLLNEIVIGLFSLKQGWFLKKISATFFVICHIHQIALSRKIVQNIRVKSDQELSKFLQASMDFTGIQAPGLSVYNKLMTIYWNLVIKLI